MSVRYLNTFLLILLQFALCSECTFAVVLFDGNLGTSPVEQDWAYLSTPLFGADSGFEFSENLLRLNTLTDISEMAGFFSEVPGLFQHPRVPLLDLSQSPVDVSFTMRQVEGIDLPDSDANSNGERNRGGFAVIVVADDGRGVELQFQHDHIVTLDDTDASFPMGERTAYDTLVTTNYTLRLSDSGYRLEADDMLLLAGRLRDYSDIAPPAPLNFPYTTPNFLFFGDDTGRAGAITELSRFEVSLLGDCNDDATHTTSDFACLSSQAERDFLLHSLGVPLGDMNADHEVNFADFLILSRNFSRTGRSYANGNLDVDPMGSVSFTDFLLLAENFGRQAAMSTSELKSVPEPNRLRAWGVALLLVVAPAKRVRCRTVVFRGLC